MGFDVYATIPPFDEFAQVTDPAVYRALPEDWWIGVSDVVDSTAASARGRYKAVNLAGAAAIAAVMNDLGHAEFPFVFGGDGATFCVPPEAKPKAAAGLAATAAWAKELLDLKLRVGLVPVSAARAAGHDLRVARFAASPDVGYAMITGGGLAWAEAEVKAGRHAVVPAPPGTRPNLAGLSCRWTPIENRRGVILSVLVTPVPRADVAGFDAVVGEVLATVATADRSGHPVPMEGPGFTWPPDGLELEARASAGLRPVGHRRRLLLLVTLLAWLLDRTGWRVGDFDPVAYRTDTARNTDFRKFDDGLRLTVDCAPETRRRLERILADAQRAGLVRYGLHAQRAALMTCIVPSALRRDHVHFLDGAEGGYARAALQLKAMAAAEGAAPVPLPFEAG